MTGRAARVLATPIGSSPPDTVHAESCMVATSHPLAAEAGMKILDAGGGAADAAVAAAAVLNVVDPRSTGIGGDAFALCWPGDDSVPAALAGAGPAPAGMSVESVRAAGYDAMPSLGPWTITVPGSVSAWGALLERYGRLGLEAVLAPAIELAEQGFAVTPFVADEWAANADRLQGDEALATFLPGGGAPRAGERFANPALGATLRRIADAGPDAFYRGELAEAIGAAVAAAGGPLRAADLAEWDGATWVEPIQRSFRGIDVYELPPPTQGLVLLEALGIYEALDAEDPVDREHTAIEALKLAFADAHAHIADPEAAAVPTAALLAERYVAQRAAAIDLTRAGDALPGRPSDTVYVAVVDGDGGACSFIQSLYEGFGSGVCVPGTGMLLQNRGGCFVLDEGHPNRPAAGKRPYHTIIPALLARDGRLAGCLGVVGGLMQPQGKLQILRGLFERGLEPQEALDAPRFRALGGRRLGCERGFDPGLRAQLAARGHEICELGRFEAGGAQLVLSGEDGLRGASDRRKDGCALGR
jgi:gamma-glutamyltranspeptidase/glutathione hydrolase